MVLKLIIQTIAFDNYATLIKGYIFALILVFAALCDIKTREIPDVIHIIIILAGLIQINMFQSLAGFIIVPLPFLISAILKEGSMGGGDIKLMAACGFFLGISGGILAIILGLMLTVFVNLLKKNKVRKKIVDKKKDDDSKKDEDKKKNEDNKKIEDSKKDLDSSFPLVPYLAVGSFISFLIICTGIMH